MGFLEILGFGRKTKSNKENIMPADTPFPSGIEKGDEVKIKYSCREYRDDKWNACTVDSSSDIYFKKHYDHIVFKAINCKGEIYGEIYIELFAEENNKTYDIYVKFDMIEPYIKKQAESVNYNNNYNNSTSINRGNIIPVDSPFPSGIKKGDKVKIRVTCGEYHDDKWNICSFDLSQDIRKFVFEAKNCKGGNYIELFAKENNEIYDIYVKSDMIFNIPADSLFPDGIKKGDLVKIRRTCGEYRDDKWNICSFDLSQDIRKFIFEAKNCKDGNFIELSANGDNKIYDIYVKSDMIFNIPTDSIFPAGIEKGDLVKIRATCREYRDDKWNVCSIDLSQDIYFKKNYDNIVFEVISCKGETYIELLSEENNKIYDIYIKSDMIEPIENKSPQSSDISNYNNHNNYIDEDYGQNNNYDIDNSDYNTDEDFIDIDEYNYCNVESIDEWCKNTDYDDGGYSWTNDYYQEFFDDEDMLDEFSSKKLCSMMYDDIYLPNSIKEKAFRRLINRANNGNAAAQYWFGVTAYEGLAGREPDKQIAYIYISLAESNGFRVSSGYREWLKNPTSEYIAERFDVNTSLNYDESDLITDNDNYDYNDDDDYNDYDDDDYDNDYEYDSYYSYSNSNSICNGDNVRINSGVNRYWTDIYNKNTRINGIPSDYYNRIWKVINNDGNKFLLESTTGKFFSKSTVRIVLAKNDISKA